MIILDIGNCKDYLNLLVWIENNKSIVEVVNTISFYTNSEWRVSIPGYLMIEDEEAALYCMMRFDLPRIEKIPSMPVQWNSDLHLT